MLWLILLRGVLCELATLQHCDIDVKSPANNQQNLRLSCQNMTFSDKVALDPCHSTQYIDSPYRYKCWQPPTTQQYTVRVPYTASKGRCRQCNECGMSGKVYQQHMDRNNCMHGCRSYYSQTKYRTEYRTKTVPGQNSTCTISYSVGTA